jgi:hypothetical protein
MLVGRMAICHVTRERMTSGTYTFGFSTVTVIAATFESAWPSLALKVKLSAPVAPTLAVKQYVADR